MGTLKRQVVTRPIPDGAVIVKRGRKKIATWISRGKKQSAELNKKGDRIRQESGSWIACYTDANGKYQQVSTGCRDKQAANAKLVQMEKNVQQVRGGIITTTELQVSKHSDKPLLEHIADFIAYHEQKGTSKIRVKAYDTRLKESADGCGWSTLRDLSSDELFKWLHGQETGERKMGPTVYNGFVEAWVAFGNWCMGKRSKGHYSKDRRLTSNPFEHFEKRSAESNRKRKARALSELELSQLLKAAAERPLIDARTVHRGKNKGQQIAKLSKERVAQLKLLGEERAMIYKTAILTGLRLNELRTLKIGNLSFGEVPFIRLDASNEKNRKGSSVPLRSDLARELQDWVKGKPKDSTVFNVPAGLLRILNRDLALAGIPKKDSDGTIVHVHALRHTFGTHLSKAGVAPRVAQGLMRHSKLELTMNTYTDARLLDTAGAIESVGLLRGDSVTSAVTSAPGLESHFVSQSDTVEQLATSNQKHENLKENTDSPGVSDSGRYRTRICDLNDVNVAL